MQFDPSRLRDVSAKGFARGKNVVLVPETPVPDSMPLSLIGGGLFAESASALPRVPSEPLGYTELHNVHVCDHGIIVDEDGTIIMGSRLRAEEWRIRYLLQRIDRLRKDGRSASLSGPVRTLPGAVLAAGEGPGCYGHWLLDFLPPLRLLKARGLFQDRPLLMSADAPGYVAGMMEVFLGGSGAEVVSLQRDTEVVFVETLIVPWRVRDHRVFNPQANTIFDAVAAEHPATGTGRKLLVSRRKFGGGWSDRSCLNFDRIEEICLGHGFEVIHPETLPFRDQVSLFSAASVIVGESGSGLHNTLFSPAGAKVIEFGPGTYTTPMQWAVSLLRGHSQISLRGGVRPGSGTKMGGQYEIAPPKLDAALRMFGAA